MTISGYRAIKGMVSADVNADPIAGNGVFEVAQEG